jgi:hypothetical protein
MQKKAIEQLGVLLINTHARGLQYGPDFDTMDDLPLIRDGAEVDQDDIIAADDQMTAFPGTWDTDSRLCLRAQSPKPCTVLGVVVGIKESDRQ